MPGKEYYIKECDRVFSIVMRQKGMDENGYVKCCTCSLITHWTRLTCGHYRKRRHMSTRWDLRNGGPQCQRCNGEGQGMDESMEIYLRAIYGESIVEELTKLSHLDKHYSVSDLKNKIQKFTIMVAA